MASSKVRLKSVLAQAAGLTVCMAGLAAAAAPQQPTPEQIKMIVQASREGLPTYQAICVSCHGPPNPNTPPRSALAEMTAEQVYASLTKGKMIFAAQTLSDSQKRSVSIYLTGKPLNAPPPESVPAIPAAPPAEAPSNPAEESHQH